MLKLKLPYFGHLMQKTNSLGSSLMLGKIEGEWGVEGDDRGWDGWMASLTRRIWVWVGYWSWWWTGKPGMLQFMGSQRVRHNWATELNWTELKLGFRFILFFFLIFILYWRRVDLGFPGGTVVKNLPTRQETWIQSLGYIYAWVLNHSTMSFLCNPIDCRPWGSSVHGIFQARILEWVAMPSSRRPSWPRNQIHVSYISYIGR